jgi:hypothetical protein
MIALLRPIVDSKGNVQAIAIFHSFNVGLQSNLESGDVRAVTMVIPQDPPTPDEPSEGLRDVFDDLH